MAMVDMRGTIMSLLARRSEDATICPSEVARVVGTGDPADDWRARMPALHAAVDALVADGLVRLSWKGAPLVGRAGPYRIGQASRRR